MTGNATERLFLRGVLGDTRGRAIPVPPGETTIGRGADQTLRLSDPFVLRSHARLWAGSGGWEIEAASWSAALYVNGRLVRVARLQAGDCLRVGSAAFRVSGGDAGSPPRMSGRIELYPLSDLLDFLRAESATGTLGVRADDGRAGALFLRGGTVAAALADERTDEPACEEIFGWQGGDFRFEPGEVPAGGPLAARTEALIAAAPRLRERARRNVAFERGDGL